MNKKLLVIAIILTCATVVAAGFLFMSEKNRNTQDDTEKPFAVEKVTLDSQIPKGFPSDLAVEQGSSTVESYEATTTDGRLQSTIILTTSKTLAQAVELYVDYFKAKGWIQPIDSTVTQNNITAVLRNKDNALQVVAKTDDAGTKTVELTLTEVNK